MRCMAAVMLAYRVPPGHGAVLALQTRRTRGRGTAAVAIPDSEASVRTASPMPRWRFVMPAWSQRTRAVSTWNRARPRFSRRTSPVDATRVSPHRGFWLQRRDRRLLEPAAAPVGADDLHPPLPLARDAHHAARLRLEVRGAVRGRLEADGRLLRRDHDGP